MGNSHASRRFHSHGTDAHGGGCAGQLIFVPSYFDYVRLRNLMKAEASEALVGLCEYTEHSDAARGRTYFLQVRGIGRRPPSPPL